MNFFSVPCKLHVPVQRKITGLEIFDFLQRDGIHPISDLAGHSARYGIKNNERLPAYHSFASRDKVQRFHYCLCRREAAEWMINMNKKTRALTTEQYIEIINTMKQGFCGLRPNERVATALVLEGNIGIRISDTVLLCLNDIVKDGERYRLSITEQKTGKQRVFTVPLIIQQYIENYCLRNGIKRTDLIFPIKERIIQKQLAIVCDYLGYEGISTHSFRKWYATEIYKANGYDIALVQRLLQHSPASVTQRYIGIEPQRIEEAIQNHTQLI